MPRKTLEIQEITIIIWNAQLLYKVGNFFGSGYFVFIYRVLIVISTQILLLIIFFNFTTFYKNSIFHYNLPSLLKIVNDVISCKIQV